MDKIKEISIKSRRDYVMEFSKKTGITDTKVDTFLKMEEEVSIRYDAFILGQEQNAWWKDTTIGVDYGTYLGNEDNVVKEKFYKGDWSYKEPNDFLKLEYRRAQRRGVGIMNSTFTLED